MLNHRPTVLTIAGFDPSGCAGILADIKTFEAHNVSGMAVCTANTKQNVDEFEEVNWVKINYLVNQLDLLQKKTKFGFVKIGLVENFNVLHIIIDELIHHNKDVKIIWDPIFKASAEFEFHSAIDKNMLETICSKLYLVTPNLDEIELFMPGEKPGVAGDHLSQFCNVLIKGGHSTDNTSNDLLFMKNKLYRFAADKLSGVSKRGTGCVLSSAITANLANGTDLEKACEKAKNYITKYLTSNDSLIGYHYYEEEHK
jgi:hydroxymethylpyrimidine/phosphomethylpyrimidine kinase